MAYKMNGAGEVYYDANGDSIMLNPKHMIELTGDETYDEHGNKQLMHEGTKSIFYKEKPRGASPWENKNRDDKIIIPPSNFA